MRKINILLKVVSIIIGLVVGVNQVIHGFPTGEIIISFSLIIIVLMPNILRRFNFRITPSIEFIYLLFIFVAQTLGSVLNFYQAFYFYDKAVHFLSGVLDSFVAIFILVRFHKYNEKSLAFNCVMIIFTVMAIAGFWEIFEYTGNLLFGGDPQKVVATGVNDTMTDIIVALLGSVLVCIAYLYEQENNKKMLIERFITEVR
jgi:uncharacterized membrane protein YjdF